MPKRMIKGSGMMEREHLLYDLTDNADEAEMNAFRNALRQLAETAKGADAIREDNAETCREILRRAGANPSDGDIQSRFGDDSAQWIAKQWLVQFDRIQGNRARIAKRGASASDIAHLVECAEELGKLQERMWWRRGVVSNGRNKRRREELMIGKLRQERTTRKAADKRKETSEDREPEWWDSSILEAKAIRKKQPWRTRWDVAGELASKVGRSQKQVAEVLKKSFWR